LRNPILINAINKSKKLIYGWKHSGILMPLLMKRSALMCTTT
jgi:hypothetical protein